MLTDEVLIKDGWKKVIPFSDADEEFVQYKMTINGFHYTVMDLRQKQLGYDGGNWFDWNCHVDNPDFESVANFEIDSLKDIDIISKLYKK